MSSQNALMGCKQRVINFLMTLAQTHNVGSVGYIVKLSIFAAATQDAFVMPWPNCQRRSTKRMSAPCGKSIKQTQNSHTDYFNVSQLLPGRYSSRNWQNFSHSNSRQDRFQDFVKIGASKIPQKPYSLHAPHYFPLPMSAILE